MSFTETLQRHCARAVPIILIDNAIDEISTVRQIREAVTYTVDTDVGHDMLYVWSLSNGMQAVGTGSASFAKSERYLQNAEKSAVVGGATTNPYSALLAVQQILMAVTEAVTNERAGFIFYMGDRILTQENNDNCNQCIQTLMDIRDLLKAMQSAVYLVGIDFAIPKELKEHIVVLQAPLPTEDEYSKIVTECYDGYRKAREEKGGKEFKNYKLTTEDKTKFVESVKGMSQFASEQTVYLSTDLNGMHLNEMRQRSIQTINSTKGLSVLEGDGRGFSAIGGLESIKQYANNLSNGRMKPRLLVLMDEVEKMHGGAQGGDLTGISQNFMGTQLTRMQDTNALGMLLAGIYGAGKSMFATRWAEELGCLAIHMDPPGMKDSLVGNSEANLRRALDVIESIGGRDGGIIYMATCNRISLLPPEFKRRFNLGTFFFYFPDPEERAKIWEIHLERYKITANANELGFSDDKWTGAEIESCCRLAYLMNCSLAEAATRIVPVATTAREEIDRLVDEANGRFLSCSQPGVFTKPNKKSQAEPVRKTTFN